MKTYHVSSEEHTNMNTMKCLYHIDSINSKQNWFATPVNLTWNIFYCHF